MNITKVALTAALFFMVSNLSAGPVYTTSNVGLIISGYPDNAIGFTITGSSVNPANCPNSGAYFVRGKITTADEKAHDTRAALAVLLTAKSSGSTIGFSILDSECYTLDQEGSGGTFPVVQRVILL